MSLADALREMDSQPVIRLHVGNMDTKSNFGVSRAALNITTNKKIGGYWRIESNLHVLILFLRDDNLRNILT